jgi:hydrogenase small subunit
MHSKLKIIWIDALTCYGCSHSFLNYKEISSLFKKVDFIYHPVFISNEFKIQSCDLLIVEGALKNNFPRLGFPLNELISKLFFKAKQVLALGTCAVYGGIFGKGLMFNNENKGHYYKCKDKIINLPGCPPHPDWISFVIDMIAENKKISLDELNRPKDIYSYTSHMGCTRNEYFEWKIYAEEFGTKEGCLFYYQGCQGPFTHSSCNKILWNEVSSKPRVGTPCFGCTEPNFPKNNLFQTDTFMGIPANIPLGVSKRAYLTLSGIAKSLTNERLSNKLLDYNCRDKDENK